MTRTQRLIIGLFLVCLFLLALPVGAQEAAGQATQETAPTSPAAGAAAPQSDAMTLALSLIEKVGYIIGFYFLFKSVPASHLNAVMKEARSDAEKTDTPLDDIAVKIGEILTEALMKVQDSRTPKTGETIIETNVIHATGDREGEAAANAIGQALAPTPGAG